MSAPLLVDIGPAQRPGGAGAAAVEECTAALIGMGAVRAVLLDPGAPIPGTLHARVFGSGLLRWNTAATVRAEGAGAVYVCFGERRAPEWVERLGVPVLAVEAATPAAAVVDAALGVAGAAAPPARRPAAVVDAALGLAGGAAPVAPLRVAVAGDAAGRDAALVEALRRRCEVDAVGDSFGDPLRAAGYDAVVHVLAGSAADVATMQSARRVPGIVFLHGVSFGDAYRAEASQRDDGAAWLAASLRSMYGARAPRAVLDGLDAGDIAAFSTDAERRFGLLLSVDVVRVARAVVVPSDDALRQLRLDQGAGGPCPPLSVCDTSDADMAAEHLLAVIASLDRTAAAA